jgi:hypothetical protein
MRSAVNGYDYFFLIQFISILHPLTLTASAQPAIRAQGTG